MDKKTKFFILLIIILALIISITLILNRLKSNEIVIYQNLDTNTIIDQTDNLYLEERARKNWKIDNMEMTIKEGSLNKDEAIVIITDNNEIAWIYGIGESFRLDKKEDNQWKELAFKDRNIGFNQVATFPKKGTHIFEMKIEWKKYYGSLKKGEYRIIKNITTYDKIEYLYAEFTIK